MIKNSIFLLLTLFLEIGCKQSGCGKLTADNKIAAGKWKQQFDKTLPLLGHRNWILVVDKAFPYQNAAGMDYIVANDSLLPVLKYVLDKVGSSGHVKAGIYRDKELSYITENQVKGVTRYSNNLNKLFANRQVQVLLHDSVFTKLDSEAKLFRILVIKTNETIPYSSVFIKLDCAYWGADEEKQLRLNMQKPVKF